MRTLRQPQGKPTGQTRLKKNASETKWHLYFWRYCIDEGDAKFASLGKFDYPFPRSARPAYQSPPSHELIDILVIAVCTLLCGGEGFNDMEDFGKAKADWFKTFLRLPHGIPSHDTFNRVFAALNPQGFLECFLHWTQSLRQAVAQEIVALDGKALRRAMNGDQSLPYIVSVWALGNGLVLGQWKVAAKSNEITALPELLRVLELAGCIVTVRRHGLSEEDCQRDYRSRCRLCDGPQRQSRNRTLQSCGW